MRKWVLIIGIALSWFLAWAIAGLPDGHLRVWFLDVGQGDAILMRLPAGEWVMVDGGPDAKVLDWMGRIMPFYERQIELVVMSHPHADHINGLVEVMQRFEVKNMLLSGVKYNYAGYQKILEDAASQKTRLWYGQKEDWRIGKVGFDLLYPQRSLQGEEMENVNNSSIVFRLIYAGKRIFFSGDLEEKKERDLTQSGQRLKSEILKAGHHGSKTSSTEELLEAVKPYYAVISCGVDNKFKHPFPGTLERLNDHGVTVFRTDIDGTVEVEIDGEDVLMKSFI
ncbi:MBL fold metallo-hydrolase [Candidatus Peregrinibacteria bacterium]|nr:MBL fold metallo-hydrolase [Candidatus Peregrinibacteria bacterium]